MSDHDEYALWTEALRITRFAYNCDCAVCSAQARRFFVNTGALDFWKTEWTGIRTELWVGQGLGRRLHGTVSGRGGSVVYRRRRGRPEHSAHPNHMARTHTSARRSLHPRLRQQASARALSLADSRKGAFRWRRLGLAARVTAE